MSTEERIIELEVRLAYQDKMITDLDEVVRAFAARVEKLERDLKDVREIAVTGAHTSDGDDGPPPHY